MPTLKCDVCQSPVEPMIPKPTRVICVKCVLNPPGGALNLATLAPPDPHWLRFDTGLLTGALKPIVDAVASVGELRLLDAQIAACKVRLLACADAAQRIHDQHDDTSSLCPLAQDLRDAAAKL